MRVANYDMQNYRNFIVTQKFLMFSYGKGVFFQVIAFYFM